ncbi:MAG: 3'(2'),5'-bisphosphate nucleotidase [Chloroflexi bacterium]|nr:3'(2'),5'-bisphosphate nucleotidase [Chloroflexota bacterium]
MQAERNTAVSAAHAAGQLAMVIRREAFQQEDTMEKIGREPVTVADFSAQAVILKMLAQAFPDDGVLAEEKAEDFTRLSGERTHAQVLHYVGQAVDQSVTADDISTWLDFGRGKGNRRFWTVDPIDGTKGFIRGDQFAIAIALIVDGIVEVGVLCCPAMPFDPARPDSSGGVIAAAVRGEGTSLLPMDDISKQHAASVTTVPDPEAARVVESVEKKHTDHGFSARVLEEAGVGGDPVRIDSQAKYLAVADGRAEIYIRNSRDGHVERIWDHAAGALVVTEAGGRVTDLDGKTLDFSRGAYLDANRGILATNGPIHDPILAAIEAVSQR